MLPAVQVSHPGSHMKQILSAGRRCWRKLSSGRQCRKISSCFSAAYQRHTAATPASTEQTPRTLDFQAGTSQLSLPFPSQPPVCRKFCPAAVVLYSTAASASSSAVWSWYIKALHPSDTLCKQYCLQQLAQLDPSSHDFLCKKLADPTPMSAN